ncbi:winged helix DNA-binding protein [Altericroceibacterium xinjiangense]|uniref:winged helix DNA-binding protein n=1 Tax=Altericroceibacterium xinjiangense TaxID=762261 RepID=UPI001F498F24|nr:winged helix DNA-binding protein [Altericroceibacterium xinjiangense]
MANADFEYAPANSGRGARLDASVFSDRRLMLAELAEDLEAAGVDVRVSGPVSTLMQGEGRLTGELVVFDCPEADEATLSALTRLDTEVARTGAELIVCTTIAALDDVYPCFGRTKPQILVDARRAERAVAIGQVLARASGARVRELSQEDRLTLMRLFEQVGHIADRLEKIGPYDAVQAAVVERPDDEPVAEPEAKRGRAELPDARLIRRIIRQRQLRSRYFDANLFADPAWDMLLDLTAARVEDTRVSVTSLCIASGVPPTTALRWITQMTQTGLLERVEDASDKRRAFIQLTDTAADAMISYFAEIGQGAARLL